MKHLLRKLHHPHRSNDNPQPPPPPSPSTLPCSVEGRSSAAVAAEGDPVQHQNQNQNQHDYITSEEEYQVQLALALSVSSSGQDPALVDSEKAPIRCGSHGGNAAADFLSRRYWDFGILDFDERIVDGFYDVHNLSSDPMVQENMPSLADLESSTGGGNFEVVIVNRKLDPVLEELMQISSCIVLDCPASEIALLIQRLAELVTKHLGGPVHDANIILAKFLERRMELRSSLHTVVLPIGSLKVGLSRHRALLFKALADNIGISCRLVKGSHYTGMDDDAVNIVKLHDDSECLVDLMGAPGTLIPADIASSKDVHLNSVNVYTYSLGNTSWKPEAQLSKASSDDGVGTSRQNEKMPNNQLSEGPSQPIQRSPLFAADRWPKFSGDGMSSNVNVVPYNPKVPEDPNNVFADLNPFQTKESGKSVMRNALAKDFGKQHAAPLMWKNRHALNETPKKNDYVNMKGSLLKEIPEAQDSSVRYINGPTDKFALRGFSQLSTVQKICVNDAENSSLNEGGIMTDKLKPDDNQADVTRMHEYEKNEGERFMRSNAKQMTTEDASCSLDVRSSFVYGDIDDVGECEIVWEDLDLGERIGLGSYGEVYRADWNGTQVAVKKFVDQDFSGAALDEFKREVRIMRRLRHPNVVLFMGAVTRPPNLSIITEFVPRGSLYRIIHRPNCQIDEKRRIKMALDVAKGMNCLHTSIPTIVHRDLKSPNLLVDSDWNVKVCDFGLSRLKHNTFLSSKSTGGTPEWMAPEVLRNEPSNEKCDVYSFGIILWELATLKLPWSGMNPMQVVGAVGFQNRRLEIPKEVDPLVAGVIWECWQTDPNLRPSFAQLCVALKPLKRLVDPSHFEQQSALASQEIAVNFAP